MLIIRFPGILLVDPTIKEGYPLWHGYSNWALTPSLHDPNPPKGPPRTTLFEDLIFWTQTYPWFDSSSEQDSSNTLQFLIQPSLHIISAEWLILCDYIKTRLGQIEWELRHPDIFGSEVINQSLKRLHTWRRVLSVHRDMVDRTISNVLPQIAVRIGVPLDQKMDNETHVEDASNSQTNRKRGLDDILSDFKSIAKELEVLQERTDRLSSVVTSSISIQDSKRGLAESRDLSRLTWLATTFIPLSFFTGLFSMASDLSALRNTFRWFFTISLPLTAILIVALAPRVWSNIWKLLKRLIKRERT
jgi:Mg2+ and Co2+ transporter CorA